MNVSFVNAILLCYFVYIAPNLLRIQRADIGIDVFLLGIIRGVLLHTIENAHNTFDGYELMLWGF